jgi:hypothetical protein
MFEYDFKNVKGWTKEQIKNGDYHDYSDTVIRNDGRNKKRRLKIFGGAGGVKYSHWVWYTCYGYWPEAKLHVHHKDGDTLNDNIENLVVMTKSEHIKHHISLLKGKDMIERYGEEKAKKLKNLISVNTKKAMANVVHPNLGKPLPEETKKKISESLKGKFTGEKNNFYGEDHSGENNPFYGKHHTEESKLRISTSNRGKVAWNKGAILSEEARINMSKNHADFSGDNNPFAGKTHSEETKKKLAEINTKHKIGDVWKDSKGVIKYKDKSGKNRRLPMKKVDKLDYIDKEKLKSLLAER